MRSSGNKKYYKKRKRSRRIRNAGTIRQKRRIKHLALVGGIIAVAVLIVFITLMVVHKKSDTISMNTDQEITCVADLLEPSYDVQLLTVNQYSRPGFTREAVNNIVIHYTANPGSTAQDNRDYFESLKDTEATHASSHFVIGLEGEVIQCIPTSEISYTSNDRNMDTISIECCHPDSTGVFTDDTYQSLVQTAAWLCSMFQLTGADFIRHYDITGKNCPKWFVEDPEAWEQFKSDVDAQLLAAQEYYDQNYSQ